MLMDEKIQKLTGIRFDINLFIRYLYELKASLANF